MKATLGTFYSFLFANLRTINPTILLLINLNEPDVVKENIFFHGWSPFFSLIKEPQTMKFFCFLIQSYWITLLYESLMGRQELLTEATALHYIMIELQKQAGSVSQIPRLFLHCVPRVHKCIAVIQPNTEPL